MSSRRTGLAKMWDFPYDTYTYSFIPGHNETLRVWHPDGTLLIMADVPFEVMSNINISLGYGGMRYHDMRWWGRWRLDIAAWWDQL